MKYIGTGLGVVSILLLSSVAQADDTSDYCQKVQARAHADAWLLFSPSVQLQAIRYPAVGNITVVGGSTDAHGDQLRGNLAWSLLDTYRGTKMLTVADKDCLQHEATNEASNLLEQMSDIGRASALQAEITYIKSHNDQIENILSITQKRLAIGNITIVDMATIQQAISALERKLVQSQGQLDIIHTKDYVLSAHSSTDIAAKLQTSSMEFEKATSQFRMLDPWTVQLSGGMVPPMSGLDTGVSWYGMISVGYNFGGAANLNVPWSTPGRVVDHPAPYGVGMDAGGKLLFKLVPNLAVGPAVSVAYLPFTGSVDKAAVLWSFGGVARLQGSRDASWSPYLEAGLSADKQAAIWNPGVKATLGADFSLESTNTFWAGPFVSASRTFQLHTDAASQTPYINHDDGNMIIAGLSLSFDAPVKQKVVATTTTVTNTATEVPCPVVVTKTVVAPAPVAAPAPESFQLSERVLFQKDSSTLDATAKSVLDAVVYEMSSHPGYSVVVEGSASAEGDATHNLSLSHSRATSVVNYLTSGGVSSDRLNTVSRGAVGNPNDGSNRSVDFLVITLVKN